MPIVLWVMGILIAAGAAAILVLIGIEAAAIVREIAEEAQEEPLPDPPQRDGTRKKGDTGPLSDPYAEARRNKEAIERLIEYFKEEEAA